MTHWSFVIRVFVFSTLRTSDQSVIWTHRFLQQRWPIASRLENQSRPRLRDCQPIYWRLVISGGAQLGCECYGAIEVNHESVTCAAERQQERRETIGNTEADIHRCVQAYTDKLHKTPSEEQRWRNLEAHYECSTEDALVNANINCMTSAFYYLYRAEVTRPGVQNLAFHCYIIVGAITM